MDGDAFLARIGQRLGRPRPERAAPRDVAGVPPVHRQNAPRSDALATRFADELQRVGGTTLVARSAAEVWTHLDRLLAEYRAATAVSWARAEFARWDVDALWSQRHCHAWVPGGDADEYRARAAAAGVGITTADLAVAETGTLVMTSAATRPRSTSLLPTHHVALVHADQLVPQLGDALARVHAAGAMPSALLFVTGPSRTSDIENDLTIGVHGPASVTVVLRVAE